MKHFILVLFAMLFCTTAFAQEFEVSTSPLRTKGLKAYQGNRQLSKPELYDLFQTVDCMEAYDSYKSGSIKLNIAKNFAICGGACLASAPLLFGAAIVINNNTSDVANPLSIILISASYGLIYAGIPAVLTSIPFYFVGRSQVRNSYEYYNYHCNKSTAMTLNVGMTSSGGFGLSLNF